MIKNVKVVKLPLVLDLGWRYLCIFGYCCFGVVPCTGQCWRYFGIISLKCGFRNIWGNYFSGIFEMLPNLVFVRGGYFKVGEEKVLEVLFRGENDEKGVFWRFEEGLGGGDIIGYVLGGALEEVGPF